MKIAMMSYTMARGQWGKDHDIAELCRFTTELGLDGIDWVTTYGVDPSEVRRITDDFGLANVCYTFPAKLQSADVAERKQAVEHVKDQLETALILGADKIMIVLPGLPDVPRERTREYAITGLSQAVPLCEANGVTPTIEHFPGATSPFAVSADMNEAVAAVPGLKITYDNGNVLMGGEAPADGYINSREHIVHAHFKDWDLAEDGRLGIDGRTYEAVLIGEGLVDPRPCLQAMAQGGYNGYIDFEYEGNLYEPAEAMRRGLPPLLDMLDEVSAGTSRG